VLKKKFVEKFMSFEKQQELCLKLLYQNSFYMLIKMLDEFLKKIAPKIMSNVFLKGTFSCSKWPFVVCFCPQHF